MNTTHRYKVNLCTSWLRFYLCRLRSSSLKLQKNTLGTSALQSEQDEHSCFAASLLQCYFLIFVFIVVLYRHNATFFL